MRRAATILCAAPWLLGGCELSNAPPFDAGRFDVREATVAPRADVFDAGAEADAPLVDVTIADISAARDVSAAVDGAPPDVPPACVALANEHAAEVRDAQRCLRDSDCDTLVCETLCCSCEVYVSAASGALSRARALESRGSTQGCTALLPCPRTPCDRAGRAVCSGEGLCVTLREAPKDAGTDR